MPLVIGAFGEINNEFDKLLKHVAEIGAERNWRTMGARSQSEARGALISYFRDIVGICAVRENARMKARVLGTLLGDYDEACKRRGSGRRRFERFRRAYFFRQTMYRDRAGAAL